MRVEIKGPFNPNRRIPELEGQRIGSIGAGFAEIHSFKPDQSGLPAELLITLVKSPMALSQVLAFLRKFPDQFLAPQKRSMGFK